MKERYGRGWRQGWSREKGGCRTHAGGMQEGCRQGYGQRCREGCRGDAGGFPGILSPISAPPPCSAPLGTLHPPHDSPAPPCWPSMGTRPPQRVARAVGGFRGSPIGMGRCRGPAEAIWQRLSPNRSWRGGRGRVAPLVTAVSAGRQCRPQNRHRAGGGGGGHDPVWGPHAPMSHRHGEGGWLRCAPRPYGTAGGVWGVPDPIGCGPWGGGRGGLPNVSRAARGPGRVTCVPPPPNINTPK